MMKLHQVVPPLAVFVVGSASPGGVACLRRGRATPLFLVPRGVVSVAPLVIADVNDRGGARPAGRTASDRWTAAPLMVDPLEGIPGLGMDMDFDAQAGPDDPNADVAITEADIEEMMQLIKDVKQGKMGPVWKKEMQAAEELFLKRDAAIRAMPGGSDDEPKPTVQELLSEKNDALEAKLREVFDLSNLRHPTDEDVMKSLDSLKNEEAQAAGGGLPGSHPDPSAAGGADEDEEYFRRIAETGDVAADDLRDLVHKYYRQRGLLNEPVVKTALGPFQLHWRQTAKTFDMWFPCMDPDDRQEDYCVSFLPQQLTIGYRGDAVTRELRGKVDVDGCFWSMQHVPGQGKVVGIVLLKRAPRYSNTWEHVFSATAAGASQP